MAKYTWESIKNDPAKRDELFRAVEALREQLKVTREEREEIEKSPEDPRNGSVYSAATRVGISLDSMKEFLERGDEGRPDFEDCMANISATLSAVKARAPWKYQSLEQTAGFGDLLRSADALLPEPGTAGAAALDWQNFLWMPGVPRSGMIGDTRNRIFFQYMALEQTTKGAEDWRKVPVDSEKLVDRGVELTRVFQDALDSDDVAEGPDDTDHLLLRSPGMPQADRIISERMGRGLESFFTKEAHKTKERLEGIDKRNQRYTKEGRLDEVKDFHKEAKKHVELLLLRRMTLDLYKKGVSSYAEFEKTYGATEKLLEAASDTFLEQCKKDNTDIKALVSDESKGKAFTGAFRTHLAELDKLPEVKDDYYSPTAKERIEALQNKMKREGADKLRCVAGILAARETVNAQRGAPGRMDPKLNERIGPGVEERARKWAERLEQLEPAQREQLFALAVKGHGGAMRDAVRDLIPNVPEEQSADKWIEDFQKSPALGKDGGADQLANIMAARMLAESVRGSKKSLTGKFLTAEAIAQKAEELKEHPTYQSFLEKLSDDPKAMQKAVAAAKSGHGGALDDMFRKHIKELPAGELSNDTLMARYMPTVKERIEALQAQAPAHRNELEYTVAEIVALRNLAHAERGNVNSLNKPIPTDDRGSLQADMSDLLKYSSLITVIDYETPNGDPLSLIAEGHGGAMTEFFRNEANDPNNNLPPPPKSKAVFNANTIGGRLDKLRQEAMALRERAVKDGVSAGAKRQARELLGEYILLDKLTRDPKTGQIDRDKLLKDVPWSKVEKNREKGFEANASFKKLTETVGDDLVNGVMDDMANLEQDAFMATMGRKMAEAARNKQADAPSRETAQPSVQAEAKKDDAAAFAHA